MRWTTWRANASWTYLSAGGAGGGGCDWAAGGGGGGWGGFRDGIASAGLQGWQARPERGERARQGLAAAPRELDRDVHVRREVALDVRE